MPPRRELPDGAAETYRAGETLFRVAAQFHISPATLKKRLIELGIPIRPQIKTPIHRAHLSEAKRMAVPPFDAAGRSTAEIGLDLGVSEETVRRRMIERDQPRLPATARPERGRWSGGRLVDPDGYLLVKVPEHPQANSGGYIREHRLVVEATMRRPLAPKEVVDHRNGVVDDNRPENLAAYASNAEHLRATLTGRRKQSTRRRQYPAGSATPSASATGALPSLRQHPLWPFAARAAMPRPYENWHWPEPDEGPPA